MTPTQQGVLAKVRCQASGLLSVARQHVAQQLQTVMSSDGIRLLEILEGHLCSKSRVCVHFNPTTLVPDYGSQARAEILNAWLQDPYV